MHGLENVDVPGLVILASGAGTIGAMLLWTIGWRRRDRQAIERLHAVPKPETVDSIEALELEVYVDSEQSGTRELLEPDYDEITVPVLYTSADLEQCTTGLTVRPIRRRVAC